MESACTTRSVLVVEGIINRESRCEEDKQTGEREFLVVIYLFVWTNVLLRISPDGIKLLASEKETQRKKTNKQKRERYSSANGDEYSSYRNRREWWKWEIRSGILGRIALKEKNPSMGRLLSSCGAYLPHSSRQNTTPSSISSNIHSVLRPPIPWNTFYAESTETECNALTQLPEEFTLSFWFSFFSCERGGFLYCFVRTWGNLIPAALGHPMGSVVHADHLHQRADCRSSIVVDFMTHHQTPRMIRLYLHCIFITSGSTTKIYCSQRSCKYHVRKLFECPLRLGKYPHWHSLAALFHEMRTHTWISVREQLIMRDRRNKIDWPYFFVVIESEHVEIDFKGKESTNQNFFKSSWLSKDDTGELDINYECNQGINFNFVYFMGYIIIILFQFFFLFQICVELVVLLFCYTNYQSNIKSFLKYFYFLPLKCNFFPANRQCSIVRRLKIIPQLGKPLASPEGGYKIITLSPL
ncbi:hypothetical protein VP01_531g3 [Puccinia sorghi]|uniref:Uncharacterized protein n=1 Tax=Puccinia sorghi TaxID=27349 RepID=A0A0L6UKZ2_9BASI|nr:hypothetical protein VP01_531g3 [Puccinia sorghi]